MPPEGYDTVTLPTEIVNRLDERADAAGRTRTEELEALFGMDDAPPDPFTEQYLVQPDLLEAAVRAHGGHAVVEGLEGWVEWLAENIDSGGGPVTLEASEYAKIADEVEGRLR